MADLGKMKVEKDITESHHELLLTTSGWLGQDTVVTQVSGKERLMGKFTKLAMFGHLSSLPVTSSGMGTFKVELLRYLDTLLPWHHMASWPSSICSPLLWAQFCPYTPSKVCMLLNKHLVCVSSALVSMVAKMNILHTVLARWGLFL